MRATGYRWCYFGMSRRPKRRAALIQALVPIATLAATGVLVWQSSYTALSATPAADSDVRPTSHLQLQNNSGGTYAVTTSADLGGTNMKPGDAGSRCVTVKSSGTVRGDLRLYVSSLADTRDLADRLEITIEAAVTPTDVTTCASFPRIGVTTLYDGVPLSSLPTTYAAAQASEISLGTHHASYVAYKISWLLDPTVDDTLMASTATAAFTWELQQP